MSERIVVSAAIVGGGPSGSVCGYLLRQAGVSCVIIDHVDFPRDKICGGGLSPKAWRLLESLMPGVSYDYNGVHHLRLLIDDRLACEFDSEAELRIVRRRDFDHVLLREYLGAGGEFRKDAVSDIDELADGTIRLRLASGAEVGCRYLIGADGSNSRVRAWLTGRREHGILAMEQYLDKGVYDQTGDVVVGLSRRYDASGYFYKFPNQVFDVIGYGDTSTTPQRFRQVLRDKHIPESRFRGAYIYLSNDYPRHDHVILIGDAGGFANRLTCEGLYDAFKTAHNAARAVIEGIPFSQTNRQVFAKMRKEKLFARIFFSAPGFAALRLMCRFPHLIKWCFDTKMKRESFFR